MSLTRICQGSITYNDTSFCSGTTPNISLEDEPIATTLLSNSIRSFTFAPVYAIEAGIPLHELSSLCRLKNVLNNRDFSISTLQSNLK